MTPPTAPSPPPGLRAWLRTPLREAIGVAAVVALGYLVLRLSEVILPGAFNDDGVYLVLGKALATGEGYRSLHIPGEPVQLKYPPGLPALLALFWLAGGTLDAVVRIATTVGLLAAAAAAGALWWFARVRLELRPALAAVCVIGPFFLESNILYNGLVITEPYFILAWAATLVLYAAWRDAARPAPQLGLAVALGLLLAAATLTRTQAIVLFGGVLLAALWDRLRPAAVAALAAAALIPLLAWRALHARLAAAGPTSTLPDETPYLAWFQWEGVGAALALAWRVTRTNVLDYGSMLAMSFGEPRAVGYAIAIVLAVAAGAGALALDRRHAVVAATAGLSVLSVVWWPYTQDRLLFSAFPVFGLLVAAGVGRVLDAGRPGLRRATVGALAIVVAVVGLRQIALRRFAYVERMPTAREEVSLPGVFLTMNSRYLLSVARWAQTATTPDDRILVEAPSGMFLYTGRQAVQSDPAQSFAAPSVFVTPGRFLATRIVEQDVTVIIVGWLAGPMASEIAVFEEACPDMLDYTGAVRRWSVAATYRVRRDDACVARVLSATDPDSANAVGPAGR